MNETTELAGPFGTMPQEPWDPEKGAKLDHIIQLNCSEVHTNASYKTTGTWDNFNNEGTKMILLSDELWWWANNSNSFVTESLSIIRSNLGLCKHSEIYLKTFMNIVMGLMLWKYIFDKERYIKQSMIFGSDRK